MADPSRFPSGLGTVTPDHPLAQYGAPNPAKWHEWFDDFNRYTAGDWVITTVELGGGSASEALADEDGGVLLITNDSNDNDSDFLQSVGELFKFETGKRLLFYARFKVSDATQSDFVIGLQIRDTTPLDVTDGVFFQKDDGDTNLDFHVEKDDTASSASAIHTMADDTYVTVGFFYDGVSGNSLAYFVDDVAQGGVVDTNLPDDEELTVSFGIQNGEAAAKTMSVDYIFVAKER